MTLMCFFFFFASGDHLGRFCRAAAGEQADAGQVHQGDREGEAGPADPGEEAHQRDQEGGQAGTDGACQNKMPPSLPVFGPVDFQHCFSP